MDELIRTPDERFATLPGYAFEPHWPTPTACGCTTSGSCAAALVPEGQPAALKRSATFDQLTVFHHASM
jgi:hypothetical protein